MLRIPERWLQPEDPKQPAPLDLFCNSHQVGACVWDCGACAAVRVLRCLPDATTDLHGRCCSQQTLTACFWTSCAFHTPAGGPMPACALLLPTPQIMHVLVALAMWQLHLGADAEHQRLTALLDGSLACPAPVWWRLLA